MVDGQAVPTGAAWLAVLILGVFSVLARDYLKEGDLDAALAGLTKAVKDDPASARNRTFLFQLLAVRGEWQRALNQLNVAGELDAAALPMVQTYREALACEALREKVFAGDRLPLVFGDPEHWIALAFESLKLVAQRKYAEARRLREEAYEAAPAASGTIDDEPFEWIADADTRLGPFFEAIVNGNYYWIPMHRLASVVIEPPEDLRDLVWIPAQLSWANGGQAIALLPARYPGTHVSGDSAAKLARRTEWAELAEETYAGTGQRMLVTDQNEYPLLDVRRIRLETSPVPTDT